MTQETKEGIRDFAIVIAIALMFVGLIAIWDNFKSTETKLKERAEWIYEQQREQYGWERGVYLP